MIYSSSFFSFFIFETMIHLHHFSLSFLSANSHSPFLSNSWSLFQLLLSAYVYVCGIYVYTHISPNITACFEQYHSHAHPQGWALGIRQSVAVLIPGEDYCSQVDISKCYYMIKWSQRPCVKPHQGEQGDCDKSEHQDRNLPVVKVLWVSSLIFRGRVTVQEYHTYFGFREHL